MREKKAHTVSPPPFKVGTSQSQGWVVSSTLGKAQMNVKITLVIVKSDKQPKKNLGKRQKSSSVPLFLRNFLGIPSEEVEEQRNLRNPRNFLNSFRGNGGTKEQRKFFSSTS